MTSAFQCEYCQCFTFKRCDKFKLKCTSHGGMYSALLRRLKNIGMTSGKLYRNALKQKSLLKIQSHYSQFNSESATPSRRKTLLALEVTPPVVYANLDIFFKKITYFVIGICLDGVQDHSLENGFH